MSEPGERQESGTGHPFARFDRVVAELLWEGRPVALVAMLAGESFASTGHLWWKRYEPPRPYLEWALTRTDDASPFPEFDDGLDFEAELFDELSRGVFRYVGVDYPLRWLAQDAVDELWEEFGC
ncbi:MULTISPECIES: hypothetical protein [unclassified Aeromicrobium]|uniref:hypothetical protein n=1 Tax=unclassified Aeromicrobium TaxID=2633570 RepID=UPI00396B1C88